MEPGFADIMLNASLEAGAAIMGYYRNGFAVERKTDASPVTDADKTADKIIRRHLEQTGIPVISEETAVTDYALRKSWKRVWIVDPLDGTKEFIKHTGEFTVNIALVEEGTPTEGLVFAPAKGLLYRTHDGVLRKEIYGRNEGDVPEQRENHILKGRNGTSPNICASISHADTATMSFIRKYRSAHPSGDIISVGSSLKFGLLAEDKAGIYPRFSPTMEWDTAAGHAVLKAAGGEVWDLKTRRPITYNRQNLRNNAFIALGPQFDVEEIFALIREGEF